MKGEWLTVATIADELAVSPRTVLRWIEHCELRAYRLPGGRLRVSRADLVEMLDAGATIPAARGTLAARPPTLEDR